MGEENNSLRQYIIYVRNYDPHHIENSTMSILKQVTEGGYYLTYSRNKYEIVSSNGYYYEPVFISHNDYESLIKYGIKYFLRKNKLERILND